MERKMRLKNNEIEILKDLQGFIEFSIKHDIRMGIVLSNIGHDVNGLLANDIGFSPRTKDYAKAMGTNWQETKKQPVKKVTHEIYRAQA